MLPLKVVIRAIVSVEIFIQASSHASSFYLLGDMEGKFSLLFLCSPALPLFILYLLFIFLRSLCCPLHFCHPFFFLYTLSNSLQYHHTREKSFFSPPLSLYIFVYCALSSISLSVHITLSFSWPFYLFHFHTMRKQQNQSQGLCFRSGYLSLVRSLILPFSFNAGQRGPWKYTSIT